MNQTRDVLREVERLKCDLSAEMELHEQVEVIDYPKETGRGHGMTTWDYAAGDSFLSRHWEHQTRTVPDQTKRHEAKRRLLELH